MSGRSEIDAIVESVLSQLSSLDAIGSDTPGAGWLEEDQIRFVRVFVEEGIGQLARSDEARFALIAECALLAGENMQDARLHLIEERLEPAEETLGGFLVNLGLMLAVELAVVSGASFALPAILGIAAARLQSLRARQLITTRVTEKHLASEGLAAMEKILKAKKQEHADAITEWNRTKLNALERSTARIAVFKAKNDYAVAQQALETSEALLQKAREAAATPKTPAETTLKSSRLQTFMEGVLAPTTLARVAENSAASVTQKMIDSDGSAGAAGLTEPFKSSTLVGLFLAETARERDEAAEAWAATQLHIRSLTDDQFINSELAQQIFFCVHSEPASASARDMVAVDRDALTLGIEGALWLAWLRTIDALGKTEVSGRPVVGGVEGRVHGTLFIKHVTIIEGSDPSEHFGTERTERLADGTVYPGLAKVRDGHAEYLYGRFAHAFFTQNPKSAPPPLVFEPSRYHEVASLPVNDLLGPNQDRLARVAEMKLLVIEFFRTFEENLEAIGGAAGQEARQILRGLLELLPDADPVSDYLESLPPISEPDLPAAEEGEFDELLPPQDPVALLEASPERAARDAATKLASLVTDLDLLITQASSTEDDERLAAIASQQDAVRSQYAEFQGLASGQSALLDEVQTDYEARIDRLTDWPTPSWKWFGPETPPTA